MIFKETLDKYDNYVKEAVDELFSKSYSNQKNDTDLLLIFQNALKDSNYQIGYDIIGYRYLTFYKFINEYRDKIFRKENHKEELEKDSFDRNYIYHYFIEQELLIYLKFWESDLILRRLYNLTRLAQGLEYSWEYDQDFYDDRRKVVKDQIQKELQNIAPKFCTLIEDIYFRQLRNAIAHSQYYLLYDSINLTNIKQCKYYKIDSIPYSDWEIIFHKNILFYNHLIRCTNEYSVKYQEQVMYKTNGLRVVLPEKDSNGEFKIGWIKYDPNDKIWYWNDI